MQIIWFCLFNQLDEERLNLLRVFEAFAGVGSQRMALQNIGIEHEVVAISEIDRFAIASYEAIHGPTVNLGDISQLQPEDIPDHDLFTYSFPCQDISVAGKQSGLDMNSGTRSGLLWECQKVIAAKKPKYLLLENVKNLVGKRHKANFDLWLDWLAEQGYSNQWQVLNAKDYGIPQNRERVFVVSILGEHEPYVFPEKQELKLRLKDVLESEVDEKYYLSQEQIARIKFSTYVQNTRRIQEKDWCDTLCARDYKDPKCVKVNQIGTFNTTTRTNSSRFRVYDDWGISPSLTTMGGGNLEPHIPIKNATKNGYIEVTDYKAPKTILQLNFRIRKLTPLECWRLMGFKDLHFYKAQEVNSNSQLYKQAGNSIVVQVLEAIFKELI